MKRISLEFPKGIQEKISTAKSLGYLAAMKFFNDLTLHALGSSEFPYDPFIEGSISATHSDNGVRNLLLLTQSATRMTGFMKENQMGRPAIEITIYREKAVLAKFLTVFWDDGKVACIEPLQEWDTYTGAKILQHLGGKRLLLLD